MFYQADEDILHFNDRFFKSEIQIMFAELDAVISEEEIATATKKLNLGKCGGPDRLLNKFFIHGVAPLPKYLKKKYLILYLKLDISQHAGQKGTLYQYAKKVILVL